MALPKELEELKSRIVSEFSKLADELLVLQDRAITAQELDQLVWKVWAYARNHQESADAERHSKAIREMVEQSMAEVQQRCELVIRASQESGRTVKKVRVKNKEILAEMANVKSGAASLRAELEKAREARDGYRKKLDNTLRQLETAKTNNRKLKKANSALQDVIDAMAKVESEKAQADAGSAGSAGSAGE